MRHTTLEVGQIVNTHGLNGEVKVVVWMDNMSDFEKLGYVYASKPASIPASKNSEKLNLEISHVKYQKATLIVQFNGIKNIDNAEKLKGYTLFVDREQLGEPKQGYYICDLIGIRVITDDGIELGTIADVFNTGGNDVYVVKPQSGKDILLPVIPDVVLSVDIDTEIARVHLIEGLID